MGVRPATDADRELVRGWRNHPQVRQASLTTHEIGPAEHARWWSAALSRPDRRIVIYLHDGVPAGVVIFDLDGQDGATWSFYVDVAGLGGDGGGSAALLAAWVALERDAVAYAFDELRLRRLGGEVLGWNAAVIALHRRFGFRETGREQRMVDGVAQDVVWLELRAEDRERGVARGGRVTAG